MTVKREDLLAAAAVGVVHYTQVDPILIFLLQRDVNLQRKGMLDQKKPSRVTVKCVLYYMGAILLLGLAGWLRGIQRGCPRFCVIGKSINAAAYAHRTGW